MDKAEYWILDSVLDIRRPVDWFSGDDPEELVARFNQKLYGLQPHELRDAFVRLTVAGALEIERVSWEALVRGDDRKVLALSRDEIQAALVTPGPLYYSLTPLGGQLWEAHSAPDWSRYVDKSYGSDHAEVIAQERALAERYVAWQHYEWPCTVVPGSEEADVLVPWQATYWKTLPVGHCIRFQCERHGPSLRWEHGERAEVRQWLDGLRKWYRSYLD